MATVTELASLLRPVPALIANPATSDDGVELVAWIPRGAAVKPGDTVRAEGDSGWRRSERRPVISVTATRVGCRLALGVPLGVSPG